VRVGLFDVYGGHMDTGWDLAALREFGFPVQQVYGERIERGGLRADLDVLVCHTGLPGARRERAPRRREPSDFAALRAALPPFEDWSDLEARAVPISSEHGLPALREFVAQGGTLIALGGEVAKAIRNFELPIATGVRIAAEDGRRPATGDEYYIPGSLLAIEVDVAHEFARGSSPVLAAVVDRGSTILEVTDAEAPIDVVARYRGTDTLLSGWAIGEELLGDKAAVLSARVAKGRVVLFGCEATYRGQPLGTMKLLFAAILAAARD
jgi:hypothetical protein